MARTQTMVQLSEEIVAALDAAAVDRGVSRSALVRQLVTDGLERARADSIGERIAEGYRRIPQGTADEWGVAADAAHATAGETMRRMDAEERAAGLSW